MSQYELVPDGKGVQIVYPRPSRETLHMQTAFLWAQRSLCSLPDRKIGAVITSWDLKRVISIGYNGPGPGLRDDYCEQWRSVRASNPPELSRCPCLHAEDNACTIAGEAPPNQPYTMFVTMQPCLICAQRIARCNIRRVIYSVGYRDHSGIDLLIEMKVRVEHLPLNQLVLDPCSADVLSRSTLKPMGYIPITAQVSFAGPTAPNLASSDSCSTLPPTSNG